MSIVPNEEFLERNYNKTLEIIEKTIEDPSRRLALLDMFKALGERYATAPASSRKEYHAAFPGGLCYHSLHVLQWIGKLAGVMAPGEFSNETLLVVSLLHDIGKVGDLEDLYVPNTSDWHVQRGMFYEVNEKIPYMRIPMRSIYLAQHWGIRLTQQEYMAILLSEGQYDQGNASYKYREPKLATLLHMAKLWAMKVEKTKDIQYP